MQKIFPHITKIFAVVILLLTFSAACSPAQAYETQPTGVYELTIAKDIFNKINSMGKNFLASFFRDESEFKLAQADEKGELVAFCDQGDQIQVKISRKSAEIWLGMMDDFSHSIFVDRDTRQVMAYMRDRFFDVRATQIQLAKID